MLGLFSQEVSHTESNETRPKSVFIELQAEDNSFFSILT